MCLCICVCVYSPGSDIQLAPVDDAGELEQDGEPASNPHPVLWGYIHIVTSVVFKCLQRRKINLYNSYI